VSDTPIRLWDRVRGLTWPLPAVVVWLAAWGWWAVFVALGLGSALAGVLATATGVLGSLWGSTRWRRVFIALGFPLSWLFSSGWAAVPAWAWLLPLALFVLLYPPASWKDAPLFPTPLDAFDGLRERVPLPPAARILDAGCGLGHALQALDRAYPDADLHGIESSWPLRLGCGVRCPFATVRQGDFWREDWSRYAMVYLFQRPETMPAAARKAAESLHPGAWLASLEFPVIGWTPTHTWSCPDGRALWLYQAPLPAPPDTVPPHSMALSDTPPADAPADTTAPRVS
jgi:hypothetical protein